MVFLEDLCWPIRTAFLVYQPFEQMGRLAVVVEHFVAAVVVPRISIFEIFLLAAPSKLELVY